MSDRLNAMKPSPFIASIHSAMKKLWLILYKSFFSFWFIKNGFPNGNSLHGRSNEVWSVPSMNEPCVWVRANTSMWLSNGWKFVSRWIHDQMAHQSGLDCLFSLVMRVRAFWTRNSVSYIYGLVFNNHTIPNVVELPRPKNNRSERVVKVNVGGWSPDAVHTLTYIQIIFFSLQNIVRVHENTNRLYTYYIQFHFKSIFGAHRSLTRSYNMSHL